VAAFIENSGRIAFAPNLEIGDRDVAAPLSKRFGRPVLVVNDANAAAWGEYECGAGRGTTHLIMLTVGTGIGGGAVIDGRLYTGSRGFAAEFGHIPVTAPDGPRCPCGSRGCLEAMASGTALARMAQEQIGNNPDSVLLDLAHGDPARITGAMVGEAGRSGDSFACELLKQLGTWLGVGMAGLAKAFDPDRIVVGGGVAENGDAFLEAAVDELSLRFAGQVEPPEVVTATLGNDAGVVGAALLALKSATGGSA
jgi:glucokinase